MRRALVFSTFDVAAVASVDHDPRANADMRRNHHATAVFELSRFVGGRSGLALDHRVGLDDFHCHGLRQRHRQRGTLVHHHVADHAVVKEIRGFTNHFAGHRDLLIALVVHESGDVAFEVEKLHLLLVEADALDCFLGAKAFDRLVTATQVAHLDLSKGASLARLHEFALHHEPELALVLEDGAGLDVDGIDLHARVSICAGRTDLAAVPTSLAPAKEGDSTVAYRRPDSSRRHNRTEKNEGARNSHFT